MSVPEEDTTVPADDTTPVVEEVVEETEVIEEVAEEEEVDNFTEVYTEGEDLFYGCNEEVEDFNAKINAGEIKMYKAFVSDSINITLYKIENVDELTKEEVETIVTPCGELGANHVLEVTDKYIIAGYPYCTGGARPDPELQPELYADLIDCEVIQDELQTLYDLQ